MRDYESLNYDKDKLRAACKSHMYLPDTLGDGVFSLYLEQILLCIYSFSLGTFALFLTRNISGMTGMWNKHGYASVKDGDLPNY